MPLTHPEGLAYDKDTFGGFFRTAPISSISDQNYTSRTTVKKDSGMAIAHLLGSLAQQKVTGSNNGDHVPTVPASRVSSPSSTGFDTLSSFSDEETDWGEDESDTSVCPIGTSTSSQNEGSRGRLNGERDLIAPILSPVKQAVVDRIMKKFWEIFNAEAVGSK
jgi:hypothetical protein